MASTLSQQLAAVRAAGVATSSGIQATRRGGQQRPSILFDGKEAADVDTFTVHQLACEGLGRLAAHEPRLGPFRSTLFSDESQSFVRELQTREVNQQLDASLQTCLLYLSPFVGEEDGARVVEYLVRRYAVHAHCAPALLTCFLPYHDRPVFHRVVRLLRLDAGGPVKALACWLPLLRPWLLSSTASSDPPPTLPRPALVRHCLKEPGFLRLLLFTASHAWEQGTLEHHPRLQALCSAVVLEALDRLGPLTEQHMRTLLPPLLRAVKARRIPREFKLTAYMALGKLASTTALSSTAAVALLVALTEGLEQGGEEEGLSVLTTVMHTQGLTRLPPRCLRAFLRSPSLPSSIPPSSPPLVSALLGHAETHPLTEALLVPAVLEGGMEGLTEGEVSAEDFLHLVRILRPLRCMEQWVPGLIWGVACLVGEGGAEGGAEGGKEGGQRVLEGLRASEKEVFATLVTFAQAQGVRAEVVTLLKGQEGTPGEGGGKGGGEGGGEDAVVGLYLAEAQKRREALEEIAVLWKEEEEKGGKEEGKEGAGEDGASQTAAVLACVRDPDARVVLRVLAEDVWRPLAVRIHPKQGSQAVAQALRWWGQERERRGGKTKGGWAGRRKGTEESEAVLVKMLESLQTWTVLWEDGGEAGREESLRGGRKAIEQDLIPALVCLLKGREDGGEGGSVQRTAWEAFIRLPHPLCALVARVETSLEGDGVPKGKEDSGLGLGEGEGGAVEAVVAAMRRLLTGKREGERATEEEKEEEEEEEEKVVLLAHALQWLGKMVEEVPGEDVREGEGEDEGSPSRSGRRRRTSASPSGPPSSFPFSFPSSPPTLAQALLPLYLDVLSEASPSTALPPSLLLHPFLPLLRALPPSIPDPFPALDPLLVRLLTLPTWVQQEGHVVSQALHLYLVHSYGSSALFALARVFAAPSFPPSFPSSPLAHVQALSVAASIVVALNGAYREGRPSCLAPAPEDAVRSLWPAALVAGCHQEKKVREGALLLLNSLFPVHDEPAGQAGGSSRDGGRAGRKTGGEASTPTHATAKSRGPDVPLHNTETTASPRQGKMNGHGPEAGAETDGKGRVGGIGKESLGGRREEGGGGAGGRRRRASAGGTMGDGEEKVGPARRRSTGSTTDRPSEGDTRGGGREDADAIGVEGEEGEGRLWWAAAVEEEERICLQRFMAALNREAAFFLLDARNALPALRKALRESGMTGSTSPSTSCPPSSSTSPLPGLLLAHLLREKTPFSHVGQVLMTMLFREPWVPSLALLPSLRTLVDRIEQGGEEEDRVEESEVRQRARSLVLQQLLHAPSSPLPSTLPSPGLPQGVVDLLRSLLFNELQGRKRGFTLLPSLLPLLDHGPALSPSLVLTLEQASSEWAKDCLPGEERLRWWESVFQVLVEAEEGGEGGGEGGEDEVSVQVLRTVACRLLDAEEFIKVFEGMFSLPGGSKDVGGNEGSPTGDGSQGSNGKNGKRGTPRKKRNPTSPEGMEGARAGGKEGGREGGQAQVLVALELLQEFRRQEEASHHPGKGVNDLHGLHQSTETLLDTAKATRNSEATWSRLIPVLLRLLPPSPVSDTRDPSPSLSSLASQGEAHVEFRQLLALDTACDILDEEARGEDAGEGAGEGGADLEITPLLSLVEATASLHVRRSAVKLLGLLVRRFPRLRAKALAYLFDWIGMDAPWERAPSFSLLVRVLEHVVPAALASSPATSSDLFTIAHTLTSAHDRILPSRRLPLYHALLRSLGDSRLAFLQFLLLLQHCAAPNTAGKGEEEDGTEALLGLTEALAGKVSEMQELFSAGDLLEMGHALLRYLLGRQEDVEGEEATEGGVEDTGKEGRESHFWVCHLRSRRDLSGKDSLPPSLPPSRPALALDLEPALRTVVTTSVREEGGEGGKKAGMEEEVARVGRILLLLGQTTRKSLARRVAMRRESDLSSAAQRGYLLLAEETLRFLHTLAQSGLRQRGTRAGRVVLPDDTGRLRVSKARSRDRQEQDVWEAVEEVAVGLLDETQPLLSLPSFLTLIQEMLADEDAGVRARALRLFHTTLAERGEALGRRKKWSRGEERLILEMLPDMFSVVGDGEGEGEGGGQDGKGRGKKGRSDPALQQTAWASMAVLVEALGKGYPQKFLPIFDRLQALVGGREGGREGGTGDSEAPGPCPQVHVITAALLCAAATCQAVGTAVLPKLPAFITTVLDRLDSPSPSSSPPPSPSSSPRVPDAALVCVTSLLTAVPNFLNPFLPRLLTCLLHTSTFPSSTLSSELDLIATALPARLLLPILFAAYPSSLTPSPPPSPEAMLRLFRVVRRVIETQQRESLLGGHGKGGGGVNVWTGFFLLAMDYRNHVGWTEGGKEGKRKRPRVEEGVLKGEGGDRAKVEEVEEAVCESMLALVLRLNEEELRALFLRVAHWKKSGDGGREGGQRSRRLVFYRLLGYLVETLRSIFVPYFGYIWSDIQADLRLFSIPSSSSVPSSILAVHNGEVSKEKKKEKKRRREEGATGEDRMEGGLEPEEKGPILITLILTALTKCFQCDDEGEEDGNFLTQTRFDAILPLLTGLITGLHSFLPPASSPSANSTYRALAEANLIPCLAYMALAAGKDVLWKPYHHQVLMQTRARAWEVRWVALRTLRETFVVVGEEYLAMLPESIAYLSELLEDEREEVVEECKNTIAYIEDLSGESLESYLA